MENNLFVEDIQDQTAEAFSQLVDATNSEKATTFKLASANLQCMDQVANITIIMLAKDIKKAALQASTETLMLILQQIVTTSPPDTGGRKNTAKKKGKQFTVFIVGHANAKQLMQAKIATTNETIIKIMQA
eukprot:12357359-Ditylum_brightwellii.AAC.1